MRAEIFGVVSGFTASVVLAGSAFPAPAEPQTANCADATVHCVGPAAEYQDIQHAVDAAGPGHRVAVAAGDYGGFRVRRGGTEDAPIRIVAASGTRIVASEPFSQEGIYLEDVSWVTLEGFEVVGSVLPGVGIGAHDARPERPMRGLVIRNNVVRGAGSTNIYLSQVADSLIEGNIAADSRASHGIYLSNAGSDGTVLRGNNTFGNAKNGIHFNGDLASTGDGLQTELLVDGNVVHDNAANGMNLDGVQRSRFQNNLVFGNGRHAFRAYAIDGAAGPRNLVLVNNTFVDNRGWAIKMSEDQGRHTVFNNILWSKAGSLSVATTQLASDFNLAPGPFVAADEELDAERWRALGLDVRSTTRTAELFVAARDFRLSADAAAIAAGVGEFNGERAPGFDLAGYSRGQWRPSLGAFAALPAGAAAQ